MGLKDKIAVITGASSGLGRALALELAQNAMNLVLAAREGGPLAQVASQAERLGSRALVQTTDVTDTGQCRALVERAVETFGGIDFLVLNAGVGMWARFDQSLYNHHKTSRRQEQKMALFRSAFAVNSG